MTALTKNTKALLRKEIPPLKSRNMRISRERQHTHSWSTTPGAFFRIYKDEPLSLEVTFQEETPSTRVMLYTNLLGETDEWGEIEFRNNLSGNFTLSVLPLKCGIFQFKLKYSPDNGKTWYWDRCPVAKVIVDPEVAKDIRMYTFIPSVSGHIGNWISALDHIGNLGFNTVHLLPVTAMDYSESPYAAADLFNIDPSFLNPSDPRSGLDQFEEFVDVAHQKGIKLCVDLVLNHIGVSSSMARQCPEWFVADQNEPDGLLRAGCWHMNKWIRWEDLGIIQYDQPEPSMRQELWTYMKQYALFWANYAAYTGGMVRFDNLHSSHPGFIGELVHTLRGAYPDLIVQAEFFSDSNTLLKTAAKCELNLLLANPWEHPFAGDLRDYLRYLHEISKNIRFLTPITTHDTGAPAQLYGTPDAAVARYFTLALLATGQTGMVQGTEHGVLEKIDFIGRKRSVSFPTPDRYNALIRKVNSLLHNYALFHEGGNIRFVDQGHGALIAAVREGRKNPREKFLLVSNLDTANTYTFKAPLSDIRQEKGSCRLQEMIQGKKILPEDDALEIEVEPCGIRAYRIDPYRG
jgi:hypothetical protein